MKQKTTLKQLQKAVSEVTSYNYKPTVFIYKGYIFYLSFFVSFDRDKAEVNFTKRLWERIIKTDEIGWSGKQLHRIQKGIETITIRCHKDHIITETKRYIDYLGTKRRKQYKLNGTEITHEWKTD